MTLLKSILNYQCPRCRSSKLFKEPFEFSKPLNMHQKCQVCNQDFEPEPGFYFGAMFISYALSVFLLLVPALVLVLGYDWSPNNAMIVVVVIAGISFFRLLRLSRSVWIHINVSYKKSHSTSIKEQI